MKNTKVRAKLYFQTLQKSTFFAESARIFDLLAQFRLTMRSRANGSPFTGNSRFFADCSICKISSFFSTKDKMPGELRAGVIYKFQCAGCNACYVGETTRHYDTRVHEHLNKKSQPSSVFQHLEANANCRAKSDKNCFQIIDADTSSFRLKVKEAIHNEWLKPSINKQKKLLKLSILV